MCGDSRELVSTTPTATATSATTNNTTTPTATATILSPPVATSITIIAFKQTTRSKRNRAGLGQTDWAGLGRAGQAGLGRAGLAKLTWLGWPHWQAGLGWGWARLG